MYKLIALLPLLALVGCSSIIDPSTASAGKKFVTNQVTRHEIGNSNNNLGAVHFSLLSNKALQSTVIVNFQQLPYHSNFDLCQDTGNYNYLKKVITNNNGESFPVYESSKVDCNSEVSITGDAKGNYLVSYSLNFLVGYRVESLKGYDAMLPQTKQRLVDNRFVQHNDVELMESKVQISLDI